jgi:hypothetical protein
VSRSPVEDQQLRSTVDGRPHRVPDPTIPAVPSPTNRAGQPSTTWRLHLDRRIDFSAIGFGRLLHIVAAEIHI